MLRNKRGYNLADWIAVFAVVSLAVAFIRVPVKRGLQEKINASADHLLWTKWGDVKDDYGGDLDKYVAGQFKGDKNTYIKTRRVQDQETAVLETKRANGQAHISNYMDYATNEESVYVSAEEGSERLLKAKTFDLNRIVE